MNKVIEELLNHSKEYFVNSIIDDIKVQCQIDAQKQNVKADIEIIFKSLKPYVEFIKVVNEQRIPPTLRFTFKIDIEGTLHGLRIENNSAGRKVKESRQKNIRLESFVFSMSISIIKLPSHDLATPILLLHKDLFKVKNLIFSE